MENTAENKERFFAQHFGQKVLILNERPDPYVLNLNSMFWVRDPDSKSIHLQLRSVDMLTDGERAKYLSLSPTTQDALEALEGRLLVADEMQKWEHLITWLRSIGIAIPFMGLSVDQLISYGWVKIVKP